MCILISTSQPLGPDGLPVLIQEVGGRAESQRPQDVSHIGLGSNDSSAFCKAMCVFKQGLTSPSLVLHTDKNVCNNSSQVGVIKCHKVFGGLLSSLRVSLWALRTGRRSPHDQHPNPSILGGPIHMTPSSVIPKWLHRYGAIMPPCWTQLTFLFGSSVSLSQWVCFVPLNCFQLWENNHTPSTIKLRHICRGFTIHLIIQQLLFSA